jgi:hypothetical protein
MRFDEPGQNPNDGPAMPAPGIGACGSSANPVTQADAPAGVLEKVARMKSRLEA